MLENNNFLGYNDHYMKQPAITIDDYSNVTINENLFEYLRSNGLDYGGAISILNA